MYCRSPYANKYFQEMYLDTQGVSSTPSASVSPTSSSISDECNSLMYSPVSISSTYGVSQTGSTSPGSGIGMSIKNMSALHQQQLLIDHQQYIADVFAAQTQQLNANNQRLKYIHSASVGVSSNQDEISKSLKMFAMLTAYSSGGEHSVSTLQPPDSSVEDVMEDFACNGYTSDELNRFQFGGTLSSNATNFGTDLYSIFHSSNGHQLVNNRGTMSNIRAAVDKANLTLTQQLHHQRHQQPNANINFNNNFSKIFPNQVKRSNADTTAAAAFNIDYNTNQKKLLKRYNIKNEKYLSAKHCVFCENNNEPEAVVKSHAVRDALGRVLCPKLRTYICPICKASGDMAHTVKYCPQKPIITMEDAIKAESFRLTKSSYYKQMKV